MKKAILIVSFGTTYPETRQKNIAAITSHHAAGPGIVSGCRGRGSCLEYDCA